MQYVYIYRLMSTSSPRIGEEEEEKEEEEDVIFGKKCNTRTQRPTLFCQYQKNIKSLKNRYMYFVSGCDNDITQSRSSLWGLKKMKMIKQV